MGLRGSWVLQQPSNPWANQSSWVPAAKKLGQGSAFWEPSGLSVSQPKVLQEWAKGMTEPWLLSGDSGGGGLGSSAYRVDPPFYRSGGCSKLHAHRWQLAWVSQEPNEIGFLLQLDTSLGMG